MNDDRKLKAPVRKRSTPPSYQGGFGDLSVVRDNRGKEWEYSEPGDVWRVVINEFGSRSTGAYSARSYEKLWADFGPLERVTPG